jgi:protein subunit release factor B
MAFVFFLGLLLALMALGCIVAAALSR